MEPFFAKLSSFHFKSFTFWTQFFSIINTKPTFFWILIMKFSFLLSFYRYFYSIRVCFVFDHRLFSHSIIRFDCRMIAIILHIACNNNLLFFAFCVYLVVRVCTGFDFDITFSSCLFFLNILCRMHTK